MDSKKTIAIVEDEAPIRAALTGLLRALGFDTVAYGSAEAFIAGYSVQRFDCILVDQNLPGIAGFELSQCLRTRHVDTPLILMTGRDEPPLRQQCKESGIPLLIKPLEAATLKHAIAAAIEARHPSL
jgi:FixJ family two-component response regulator